MRRNHGRDMSEGGRGSRLEELIRREVNFLLRSEILDPRLDGIEITMVELAGDGSSARLWYTAADAQDHSRALDHASGYIRSELADSLGLRRTPELRFRRDPATRSFVGAELQ